MDLKLFGFILRLEKMKMKMIRTEQNEYEGEKEDSTFKLPFCPFQI